MFLVVLERLDSVYGRIEIMDQTYLDDLLQIPTLKNQEAGNLKSFANRLHGAVATLPNPSMHRNFTAVLP